MSTEIVGQPVILTVHFIFKDNVDPTASVDLNKKVQVLDTDNAEQVVEKALNKLPERPQGEYILWQPNRHTLFLPHQILGATGYDSTEALDVRPRIQRFKFELIDRTIKTFQIDVTMTVEKLLEYVGEKVEITHTDEYGFKVYDETKKVENNFWLDPLRVFYEQINSEDVLLIRLKKRFFFRDKNVADNDAKQLHLIYTDCSNRIADGMIPVGRDKCFNLVALNCIVEFGNYEEKFGHIDPNAKGFEKKLPDVKKFFPEIYRKKLNVKDYQYLVKLWRDLSATRVTQLQGKYRYCQMIMQEKTYGLEIFKVAIRKAGKAKEIPKIFGICKDYVILQDPDGSNEEVWAISKIARFAVGKSVFIIDLGNHSTNYITLITEEGDLISASLSGYIDLISKRKKEQALAEKETEPDFSYTEKIEDVPVGEQQTKKKKAVPKVTQTQSVPQMVEPEAQVEQVQLCIEKYSELTFEESSAEAVQFSSEVMVDSAQCIGDFCSNLYSADAAVVNDALSKLAAQTDVLFSQFCASKKADFGSCVMNADEDEEQMLVACRALTERAQMLVDAHESGLQSAVLVASTEEVEILPPEMFVIQASIASIQAMCNKATINDNGSQMLLHELSRAVGEGLFDLAAMSVEFDIKGEKIVEANKALNALGEAQIAAMKLIAVTSGEEGCQKLMKEMKHTMDVALSNYIAMIEQSGLDPESVEYQTIMEQINVIKMNWEALLAGSEMKGIEAEKNVLSMIQNLSAVFNELAQLSNPLVTPQQVEVSIDNLEDILENTKQTCKAIAQERIDDDEPEQVAVILEAFKDVVNKFFVVRDKIESGERGEMVEDDCILMRQAMEKLMQSCGMEEIGENMQGLALNSMTKTAVARRIALTAQVRRVIKNKHIKDKNLQKRLLAATRSMNNQIEEMLKLLALPVDEQGQKLPDKVKEFAPATYKMVCEVMDTLAEIENNQSRNALEFSCNEAEKATFDMANLNNLFNNTKQARKDAVLAKKVEFDDIENEIELLLGDMDNDKYEFQTVNVEGVRAKAKEQIEQSIKDFAEPLKKIRETPLEDLPNVMVKLQDIVRKNFRGAKAYATTAKKADYRKRLLEASKRLADSMKGIIDLSLDENYDEIAKKALLLQEIWEDMDEVMKEITMDDIVERQESKEEEIQDAATKELVGAANVINSAMDKINAALEFAKKKKAERERQLAAEQQALYDAAVAQNEELAKQQIIKRKTTKKLDDTELSVQILEDAQQLIAFTSDLIGSATEAQKIITANEGEVVEKKDVYNKDANWEEGLISAAKTVTGCIQYLVKAANDQVIHNKPSEAMLVACAKSVAANAIQLQTASMVKLEGGHPMRQKLAQIINKIIDSQNKFVKTVSSGADARSDVPPPKARNAQQLRIMLMEASVNIQNIEKELSQAQDELKRMRRARYGNAQKPIPSVGGGFGGMKTTTPRGAQTTTTGGFQRGGIQRGAATTTGAARGGFGAGRQFGSSNNIQQQQKTATTGGFQRGGFGAGRQFGSNNNIQQQQEQKPATTGGFQRGGFQRGATAQQQRGSFIGRGQQKPEEPKVEEKKEEKPQELTTQQKEQMQALQEMQEAAGELKGGVQAVEEKKEEQSGQKLPFQRTGGFAPRQAQQSGQQAPRRGFVGRGRTNQGNQEEPKKEEETKPEEPKVEETKPEEPPKVEEKKEEVKVEEKKEEPKTEDVPTASSARSAFQQRAAMFNSQENMNQPVQRNFKIAARPRPAPKQEEKKDDGNELAAILARRRNME